MKRVTLASLGALLIAGCTVGPDYQRPQVELPQAWRSGEALPASEKPEELANLAWWKQLEDPVLDALVTEALANNRDLKIAAARIDEAAGLLGSTRAQLFPQVGASLSGSRARSSQSTAIPIPAAVDTTNEPVFRRPQRRLGDRSVRPPAPRHRSQPGRAAGHRGSPPRPGAVAGGHRRQQLHQPARSRQRTGDLPPHPENARGGPADFRVALPGRRRFRDGTVAGALRGGDGTHRRPYARTGGGPAGKRHFRSAWPAAGADCARQDAGRDEPAAAAGQPALERARTAPGYPPGRADSGFQQCPHRRRQGRVFPDGDADRPARIEQRCAVQPVQRPGTGLVLRRRRGAADFYRGRHRRAGPGSRSPPGAGAGAIPQDRRECLPRSRRCPDRRHQDAARSWMPASGRSKR